MTWLDDLNAWCARYTRSVWFMPVVFALAVLNFMLAIVLALTNGPDWLWILPVIGAFAGLQLVFWGRRP